MNLVILILSLVVISVLSFVSGYFLGRIHESEKLTKKLKEIVKKMEDYNSQKETNTEASEERYLSWLEADRKQARAEADANDLKIDEWKEERKKKEFEPMSPKDLDNAYPY